MNAAADLIAEARRHRVVVARYGNTIKLRAPTSPPTDLVARLRERKAELLAILPDLTSITGETARVVVNFRFPDYPARAWASCIGAAGDTRESVVAELRAKWPNVEIDGEIDAPTARPIDPATLPNPRPHHDRIA